MKKLIILIGLAVALIGGVIIMKAGNFGAAAIWNISAGGKWLLPLISVAALVDSINPCAFSVLILTIAFLFSIGRTRGGIVKIGSAYIIGIFVVYVLIGLGILQTLHFFNTPHFMAKAAALLLILFGLINLINRFFPAFPIKLKIPDAAHHKMAVLMERASLPTAFILGVFVGMCEFPCTGGPYLMVLGLLHDQATYAAGLAYLLYYNLIFILPLVIILAIAGNQTLLAKVQDWKKQESKKLRLVSGIVMTLLGLIIFFL